MGVRPVTKSVGKREDPRGLTEKQIPIYKKKGDILQCRNHRGIKLMEDLLKVWERTVDGRLKEVVEVSNMVSIYVR